MLAIKMQVSYAATGCTFTKSARAKINAALMYFPMRCHSVAFGMAQSTPSSATQSFAADHMLL